MTQVIAYCGLECHECEAYLATQANDSAKAGAVAAKWSTPEMSFSADDVWCDGCLVGEGRIFSWCAECPIRTCCSDKGLPNCPHCPDLPCVIISESPGGALERLVALRAQL